MATQHPNEDVLDQLREGIATLTSSERWTRWLEAQSRFHHYSFGNTLLILLQRPDATRVAGYRAWLQLRRQVRKGEKGIAILAPIANRIRVEDENGEEKVLAGPAHAFRIAHVFDVAQTDGDDLPTVSDRLTGDDPDEIYSKLVVWKGRHGHATPRCIKRRVTRDGIICLWATRVPRWIRCRLSE